MVKDTPTLQSLHVLGDPPERADAARNRRKILVAAERLIAERGIENVCMDSIASEAGVGKGTLYRRFGDRAGLAHSLLEEHTRGFQDELLRGEPPLGPGAPPAARLKAFLSGMAAILDRHVELIAVAEMTPASRFRVGVYRAYHLHVRLLVEQINPRLDAVAMAHALLAPLSADLFRHMRDERGAGLADVTAALDALVDGLAAAARN